MAAPLLGANGAGRQGSRQHAIHPQKKGARSAAEQAGAALAVGTIKGKPLPLLATGGAATAVRAAEVQAITAFWLRDATKFPRRTPTPTPSFYFPHPFAHGGDCLRSFLGLLSISGKRGAADREGETATCALQVSGKPGWGTLVGPPPPSSATACRSTRGMQPE